MPNARTASGWMWKITETGETHPDLMLFELKDVDISSMTIHLPETHKMPELEPPEFQREDCQCELDYACGGDCCGMMWYTCAMHRALGMDASDIYQAWMDSDD